MSGEGTPERWWKCPDCGDKISDEDSRSVDTAQDGTMVIERLCPECGVQLEAMSDLEQAGAKRARAQAALAELQQLDFCAMSDPDLLEAIEILERQHRAARNEAKKRSLIDDYGHTIETDGAQWFVRCTHAANDPDWFTVDPEDGDRMDESCWVRTWNSDDGWGEALRYAIGMNGQAPVPVAAIGIEPFMASMFSITKVSALSGIAVVSDHILETDGVDWNTTCLHGDDQEKFFHSGRCITKAGDLNERIHAAFSMRYPDVPKRFSLGSVDIAWDGDGPTIERFAPKVRFLTGDEIDG